MTCKHCGKPIYSTGAIWLHRDGHLTQCTLPTYAEPAEPERPTSLRPQVGQTRETR